MPDRLGSAIAAVLIPAAVVVTAPGVTAAAGPVGASEPLVTVQDPAITESSGLVARSDELLTVNDSGDRGVVYVVDRSSGRTVGRTTWSEAPADVEALAPGRGADVWVADIGDNLEERETVSVTRVSAGRGEAVAEGATYRLRYPDGAHDAEALLVHPRTGRLYVATKGLLGGGWYAAPRRLRSGEVHRLRRLGRLGPLVTDGAFLPDGRGFVLRDYARATVYSYPALERLASVDLPEQQQGEGLAVRGPWLYLSSEGVRQPILRVPLPDVAAEAGVSGPAAVAAPPPSPTAEKSTAAEGTEEQTEGWRVARRVVGGVIAAALLVVIGMRLRRRSGLKRRR